MTCYVVTAGDAPGVSSGGGQGPDGTMEVLTLAIFCHEGHPPADDIFVYDGCQPPVPGRSPRPGPRASPPPRPRPGPAEEARTPAPAGRAARRRDRGGDRGVAVVRRDRAV